MSAYIPILIFILVAAAFPIATLLLARLVRPANYGKVKMAAYECGVEAEGEARGRYSVSYYIIAVLFVVFDVEVIFLFPWAVRFDALGLFGFVEMVIFIGILVLGYFYAWKKGALEWV
ncbi:MAG TPA: NADH-quinone oxidoreductase subunit A [Candidatus Polarisedimenticolia bacterium]|nr:NADH-quinone oxidoreductase subunit A [Candidatus Polarisedimenticolia bacterium]